jgi:hypothetical protein
VRVRWDRLWADLSAQAEALERVEFEAEVADRVSVEQASVLLMDRVRASLGRHLRCDVTGAPPWRGVLGGYGRDWLALTRTDPSHAQTVLVPLSAVRGVTGLARQAVLDDALSPVGRRVTLAMALRHLRDDAHETTLHRSGTPPLRGLVRSVGRDYVDLVDDEGTCWSVPLSALLGVSLW